MPCCYVMLAVCWVLLLFVVDSSVGLACMVPARWALTKVVMCFAAGDATDGVHLLCPGSHCRLLRCCPSPLGSDGGEACAVWFIGLVFKNRHRLWMCVCDLNFT